VLPVALLAEDVLGGCRPIEQPHLRDGIEARLAVELRKRMSTTVRENHEDVLDRMQDRLDRMPKAMGVRRQTVEHPFGTLKAWMGATHFLTRTLDKVRTEMSLHVLVYNLKRMITIFVEPLMAAIRA
jgi:Transposase DDE domain